MVDVIIFFSCLLAFLLVFFLLREAVLWYWRINDIADSLRWTATHLADINKNLERIGMSDGEKEVKKNKELGGAIEKMKEEGN